MRFQDKVAIVTGGSSGIGKEVATRFVAEGESVVIIGRDAAKAEAAAKQIDVTGKRAIAHVGDISLLATGQAAVKAALDRFGRLDVLFNNAGIFGPKPFLDVTEDEYDRFLSIILKGKFFVAQAAAKAMKAAGRGPHEGRQAVTARARVDASHQSPPPPLPARAHPPLHAPPLLSRRSHIANGEPQWVQTFKKNYSRTSKSAQSH